MKERTYRSMDDFIFWHAPEKNTKRAMKYILLILATEGLRGKELKEYLHNWNLTADEARVSYSSLMHARKLYAKEGQLGLLKPYGKRGVKINFPDLGAMEA